MTHRRMFIVTREGDHPVLAFHPLTEADRRYGFRQVEIAPAEWNGDMGTAPRDGTPVDLWAGGKRMIDYSFVGGQWCRLKGTPAKWAPLRSTPTHWRPTPPSPAGARE